MPALIKLLEIRESGVGKTERRVNKARPLSLRLLIQAEMALASGAFFGMLAMMCIVFLSMSNLVSDLVIAATIFSGLSVIVAVALLGISSAVIAAKLDYKK
ncbi:Uncharacterised protein [Legionella beliardensis]|uniref:Uncharacterized protein n=1 Tax=Legionella beliardensis TaxID=91822 RepID=A0A378IAM7_9GAMM|nr:hypothetical protein [Legionella beliardensis]STX29374.1 Uncharacterised protein [Legionella beliardensis]